MLTKDLHEIPKVRDRWSFLYVEHCRIEQEDKAIALYEAAARGDGPQAIADWGAAVGFPHACGDGPTH